jgi:hypothetical protein
MKETIKVQRVDELDQYCLTWTYFVVVDGNEVILSHGRSSEAQARAEIAERVRELFGADAEVVEDWL